MSVCLRSVPRSESGCCLPYFRHQTVSFDTRSNRIVLQVYFNVLADVWLKHGQTETRWDPERGPETRARGRTPSQANQDRQETRDQGRFTNRFCECRFLGRRPLLGSGVGSRGQCTEPSAFPVPTGTRPPNRRSKAFLS